jgi:hypothetical protein
MKPGCSMRAVQPADDVIGGCGVYQIDSLTDAGGISRNTRCDAPEARDLEDEHRIAAPDGRKSVRNTREFV